jgi:adenylate cyclase
MKKGLTLFIIIICCYSAAAQDNKNSFMDSLLLNLKNSQNSIREVKPTTDQIAAIFRNGIPKEKEKFHQFIQQTLSLAIKIEDQYGEAWANYYLARYNISTANGYSRSLPLLLKGIALFEKIEDKRGISLCYMQMGLISYLTQFYEDAIKNFDLSLSFYANPTSTYLTAISLAELKNFAESKKQFFKAIRDFEKVNRNNSMNECYMYLGQMYVKEGVLDSAYFFLDLALKYQIKNKQRKSRPYALFSEYFLAKGDLDSAESSALKSIALSSVENDNLSPLISSQILAQVYGSKADFEKAFWYLKMHYDLKNKEFQYGSKQKIAQMQTIFEFKKKIGEEERRHEEEMRQKNRTKNIFLISSVFVLIVAGGLFSRLLYMRKSKAALQEEKNISENLLLNILPAEIALELKEKGAAKARNFELASIVFTDFKSFTEKSEQLDATHLVKEINHCFRAFDGIVDKYNIEKIKTIGDAYMAAGGLPIPTDDSVKNTVLAALEMQDFIGKRKADMDAAGEASFEMRVGIHTGPVVAGIVGLKKFQYDIWGDTVNTASRMESNGTVSQVNISHATYELLKDEPLFSFESRGKIEVKGKGQMDMYYVKLR